MCYSKNPEPSSDILSYHEFALIMPLATSIPFTPRSSALRTSLLSTIPAPQITPVAVEYSDTNFTESSITFGFYFETAFLEPINSGGSIAIKFGLNLASSAASLDVLAHRTETIFNSLNL